MLKAITRRSTTANRVYHAYRRRQREALRPNWQSILTQDGNLWSTARECARAGPRVVLATSTGGHPSAPLMDGVLAAALTLRGAAVSFLLCDSALPACQMAEVGLMQSGPFAREGTAKYFCKGCFSNAAQMFEPFGLHIHRYSSFLRCEDIEEADRIADAVPLRDLKFFRHQGLAVGEHALAGAIRYFASATLEHQYDAEAVARRYLRAALLTGRAMRRLLEMARPDVVCLNHGIYVPHGVASEVARSMGCRVVTWNVAYRSRSFIFSHDDTYHHTLMSEPTSEWEDMDWSDDLEEEILTYLRSRRRGGRDWIVFHSRNSIEHPGGILRDLAGIDPEKPRVIMLTNVAWDAQLHYPANAFCDMLDWVVKTIAYFETRQDLQLIVRIHPAEVSGDIPSRQPVLQHIREQFRDLPGNVFLIEPQSPLSTYAVAEECNAALIYGTKTGVELTALGIPVIVAGEAWIRNKGLTRDAKSEAHYFELLEQLPLAGRMPAEQVQRARKYAYHFFLRRMITVDQVAPASSGGIFKVSASGIAEFQEGVSAGLDVICDGILRKHPFVIRTEHGNAR